MPYYKNIKYKHIKKSKVSHEIKTSTNMTKMRPEMYAKENVKTDAYQKR